MRRVIPGPNQESVWDYPRPPAIEPSAHSIRVEFGGREVAHTDRALRVIETSHPPVYYIPIEDIDSELLESSTKKTFCEYKGQASYFSIRVGGKRSTNAAWTYPNPSPGYEDLADTVAFYPGRADACYVGDEKVQPQDGDFYGGWITTEIVGPFKGGPGSSAW